MPVQHLLKQLENYQPRQTRDVRPDWVTGFINQTADLFEPLADVGRVGFDCRLAENCWEVDIYLGRMEMMGGAEDGQAHPTGFMFDLQTLLNQFDVVHHFEFVALPHETDGSQIRASVAMIGAIQENELKVQIYSLPPETVGPGLRCFPDGSLHTV